LNGSCIASYVNNVVQTSATSESHHHFLVETCTGRIQNSYNFISSVFIAYALYKLLCSPKLNLIVLRVLLGILHSLFVDLDSNDLHIRNFILNGNADGADSTS